MLELESLAVVWPSRRWMRGRGEGRSTTSPTPVTAAVTASPAPLSVSLSRSVSTVSTVPCRPQSPSSDCVSPLLRQVSVCVPSCRPLSSSAPASTRLTFTTYSTIVTFTWPALSTCTLLSCSKVCTDTSFTTRWLGLQLAVSLASLP